MFFILSTGRSGTKTIAQAISQLEGIYCVHEPDPVLAVESSNYRYGNISGDMIMNILLKSRPTRVDGSIYCESNQAISLIIPIVIQTFPKARFIWLIRNGLDVVASAMQKQWYTGHSENYDDYESAPLLQQEWIKGRINGDKCGDVPEELWSTYTRFEKCCWYWEYVNRTIEIDLTNHSNNDYFLINLENIQSQLPLLIDWMGFKIDESPRIPAANTAKRPPYHWKKWTHIEKRTFEAHCGRLMSKFYPEWLSIHGDWRGVLYETDLQRDYSTFLLENIKRIIRKFKDK